MNVSTSLRLDHPAAEVVWLEGMDETLATPADFRPGEASDFTMMASFATLSPTLGSLYFPVIDEGIRPHVSIESPGQNFSYRYEADPPHWEDATGERFPALAPKFWGNGTTWTVKLAFPEGSDPAHWRIPIVTGISHDRLGEVFGRDAQWSSG